MTPPGHGIWPTWILPWCAPHPCFKTAHYAVFHTGPSATGDIEGVLIHGAQGVRSFLGAGSHALPTCNGFTPGQGGLLLPAQGIARGCHVRFVPG